MDNSQPSKLTATPNWRRRRQLSLAALVLLSALCAPLDTLVSAYDKSVTTPGWDTTTGYTVLASSFSAIAISVPIYFWCRYDSFLRMFPLSLGLQLLIFFFGILGVPVYFCWSRTQRECWNSCFGLFLYALWFVVYFLSWRLVAYVIPGI
jgi:hypothetical protein